METFTYRCKPPGKTHAVRKNSPQALCGLTTSDMRAKVVGVTVLDNLCRSCKLVMDKLNPPPVEVPVEAPKKKSWFRRKAKG